MLKGVHRLYPISISILVMESDDAFFFLLVLKIYLWLWQILKSISWTCNFNCCHHHHQQKRTKRNWTALLYHHLVMVLVVRIRDRLSKKQRLLIAFNFFSWHPSSISSETKGEFFWRKPKIIMMLTCSFFAVWCNQTNQKNEIRIWRVIFILRERERERERERKPDLTFCNHIWYTLSVGQLLKRITIGW